MIKLILAGIVLTLVSTSAMTSPTIMFTNPAFIGKKIDKKDQSEEKEKYDVGKIIYPVPQEEFNNCDKTYTDKCIQKMEKK